MKPTSPVAPLLREFLRVFSCRLAHPADGDALFNVWYVVLRGVCFEHSQQRIVSVGVVMRRVAEVAHIFSPECWHAPYEATALYLVKKAPK